MTRVVDTFARTATNQWGSTPSGLAWTMWNGVAEDRSVSPGAARVTLWDTPNLVRGQYINRPWKDGEVLTHMRAGQTSVGEPVTAGVLLRYGASVYYRVRLLFETDSTIQVGITRGATTVGSQVDTGLSYGAGTRIRLRARVDGHRVRARVWSASGTEPSVWQVDETIPAGSQIAAGSMGTFVAAGVGNTNPDPWIEFERIELAYDLLTENDLTGTAGVQVTNARLADTAGTGTVTIASPGSRAVYDDTHTVLDRSMIRLESGRHRAETPRLRVALPSSGPWCVRWYVHMPRLQDAGHGTSEVRTVAAWSPSGRSWVVHATAAGNAGTRLQDADLAAPAVGWDDEAGQAVPTGQMWRVELRYTGSDLVSRVYPGHDVDRFREHTWQGVGDPGRALDLTGYRWRRRPTLYWGDQNTQVRDLQNELLDLGYNLGAAGADGDFGDATYNAVLSFQGTHGISPVDGIPGPETRAAMDMALGRVPLPLWVSHVAVSVGEWVGPVEPPPPPPVTARMGFTVGIPI